MSKIRTAAAMGAAAALIAALAGCSSGGSDSKTVTIWYRPNSLPAASIKGVQKQFPDVTIKLVKTPDVDTKLTSALRANSGVPDIAVANTQPLRSAQSKIVDVSKYGFASVKSDYLDWKVKAAQGDDGAQIGIPIDIGPEGFFYRVDKFKAAGLPTDPADVGKLVSTFDGYEQVAQTTKDKLGAFVCDSPDSSVYVPKTFGQGYFYYSSDGKLDPGSAVNKQGFIDATTFGQKGLCLNAQPYQSDWSAGASQGKLVGFVGPAYEATLLSSSAQNSSGQWRVTTAPGGSSSQIGSNLSVFKTNADPKVTTKIAIWLTNATNQASGYQTDRLFPSTPASYSMAAMKEPESYFGGQVTAQVFAGIAKDAPTVTTGPASITTQTVFNNAMIDAVKNKTNPSDAFAKALSAAPTAQ
ncbi:ABC transporter substrate-binding protein [Amnibacterium setariae]|uniref:Extracellular solute-binding protein n=1 Tax=Amnibacterium setariae TaxID=2306585 RepID=A0A3A1U0Z2_9MICO|nr:extracellular solute-binding protein [Amnibacterium setariae]RIX30534.1 extracellular solute-binding protein [Amnibacterium setariae]